MKVSGFTLIRNGVQFDYPFEESIRSLFPLVDEMVVNVGYGDDDTIDRIGALARELGSEKFVVFQSRWPLDDPEKKRGGLILSEQTNLALERCNGDWCLYLQADEVLHEDDYGKIKHALRVAHEDPKIEGLLFDYIHLYGSFDVVQDTRSAYRREVRAIRKSSGARSVGDAQSFRKRDDGKLDVVRVGARVFHYGWVRTPEAMRAKTYFMDRLYHGDYEPSQETPHTGDNYRYKKFWGLKPYLGTHPTWMKERIRSRGWKWDLAHSKSVWSHKDIKKVILDTFEKLTGLRLFEYRSYRLLEDWVKRPRQGAPIESKFASILLSTYDLPHHLSMVLESLDRQTTRDFEILLCDDGSGPQTREVVEEFSRRSTLAFTHLWQPNRGFRKCRILNEGIRRSKGDVLIFLDGDCVVHPDFVLDHMQNQEEHRYLAGRRMELGERDSEKLGLEWIRSGAHGRVGWRFLFSDSERVNRSVRVRGSWLRKMLGLEKIDDLKGCNFSVPRAALFPLDGFDEAFEGYGREDTDIEYRLQHLGLRIKSLKGLAIQYHLWHPRRGFTQKNEELLLRTRLEARVRSRRGLSLNTFRTESEAPHG